MATYEYTHSNVMYKPWDAINSETPYKQKYIYIGAGKLFWG